MNFRWFLSSRVRQATEMHRQVRKLVNHQRDLLSPAAIDGLGGAMAAMESALTGGAANDALKKQMDGLETAANKWLKPYPNASIRENIEVFLVAIAVAVGIRTFFLQPFKIPTGSMQPTLFGVTPPPVPEGPGNDPTLQIPNGLTRFFSYWINGISYYHVTAKTGGQLNAIKPPVRFLLFNLKQEFRIGGTWQTVWFPVDELFARAGVADRHGRLTPHQFEPGEDVVRLRVASGDHLFVDRFTYNFRKPDRGEIIVFATAGTAIIQQDQFYIKRLVGLPGEQISIGDDQHVRINGERLDASTPHFENVYTFEAGQPPENGMRGYFGHVNSANRFRPGIAPKFPTGEAVFTLTPEQYLALGDNTLNSSDSRDWGAVPVENVIGKSFFVYWPITSRFGWGHR